MAGCQAIAATLARPQRVHAAVQSPSALSPRRNFAWVVTGNAVAAMSRWGILVVLARLGSVEMIGQVLLALAICAPAATFSLLGLRGLLITDTHGQYQFGDYLGLRLIGVAASCLVVWTIAGLGGYEPVVAAMIAVAAVGATFESIGEIFHGLFQLHERMDRIGVALMLRGPLMLGLLGLGVLATGSALGGVAGIALAQAMELFLWDLPMGKRILAGIAGETRRCRQFCTPEVLQAGSANVCGVKGDSPISVGMEIRTVAQAIRPRWEFHTLRRLAWLSVPLTVVATLLAFYPNLPRYAVAHALGDAGLGIFGPLAALGTLSHMVVIAICQSCTPRLARHYADGRTAEFTGLLGKSLLAVLCLDGAMLVTIALAGGPILRILYGDAFAPYANLAFWLSVATALFHLHVPLSRAVQAMHRFKTHMIATIAGTATLVLALPSFVGGHGLYGASAAMILAAMVLLVSHAAAVIWLLSGGAVRNCVLRRFFSASKGTVPCSWARKSGQFHGDGPVPPPEPPPLRVLHVFGRLGFGGAEMRMLEVFHHIDRRKYRFDCCALSGLPGELDERIRGLGAQLHLLRLKSPGFARRLRCLLREGHYDAVHSHVYLASGIILRLASQAGTAVRIAQLHNTHDSRATWLGRRLYRAWMRRWIDRYATHIVGVSRGVMDSTWGAGWEADPRCQVIYNAVDVSAFDAPVNTGEARRELGLADDALVAIHVGRIMPQKNHLRLVAIFAELVRRRPDARLVLVGRTLRDGVESRLRQRIAELGLDRHVIFAGERPDVPRLLRAADVLIFPSLWEGLPGAVQEACLAALPVVASDLPGVREIAGQMPGVVPMPLEADDSQWADAVQRVLNHPRNHRSEEQARVAFARSDFAIERAVDRMCRIWQGQHGKSSNTLVRQRAA